MKPLFSILSFSFSTVLLIFISIGLTQCSGGSTSENEAAKTDSIDASKAKMKEELSDEKRIIKEDLKRIQDRIDDRLEELDRKSEKASDKAKKDIEEERTTLQRDRERVIVMSNDIETTNAEDLRVFREKVQVMFDDIEMDLKKFAKDIEKSLQ